MPLGLMKSVTRSIVWRHKLAESAWRYERAMTISYTFPNDRYQEVVEVLYL